MLERASQILIQQLYRGYPEVEETIYHLIPEKSDRNQQIYELYKNGETPDQIASKFDISVQRVHQIIQKFAYKQSL